MNRTNVEATLRLLERTRDAMTLRQKRVAEFDMMQWLNHDPECGTVACIAGFACIATRDQTPMEKLFRLEGVNATAGDALGLTLDEEDHWFIGRFAPDLSIEAITIHHAIAFLQKVLLTGDTMVTIDVEENSAPEPEKLLTFVNV